MSESRQIPVYGRDGRLGWVEPTPDAQSGDDVQIRLENGALIQVPDDLLVRQEDGSYYLPMSAGQFEQADTGESRDRNQHERLMVVPVVMEEAQVGKRRTTRRVLVHKAVHQREEMIDQPGFQDEVHVERVPVNQVVQSAPKARQEGDTLVIPVLEEVLVVEKRLVLKEEVRITRQRRTTHNPQRVTLRSEEVQVERLEPEEEAAPSNPGDAGPVNSVNPADPGDQLAD